MRWRQQELDTEESAALPGLARLSGLVRSVRTPAFAGITFHEVVAKSALNKVPGGSPMPFGWTVNPYRGCSHACTYCLDPATSISMADGRRLPLAEVRPGDEVVGTVVGGRYRRYVPSVVSAVWATRKPAFRLILADGTELLASGDHRFLTRRGWKHVTGTMSGSHRRPHLTVNDSLLGVGNVRGGLAELMRFSALTTPATSRKWPMIGHAVKTVADLGVMSIEPVGVRDLVDISTSTGDFVANGVISHNCFARNSHTYLDFDAGHDFDTQIIVKINVGTLLRKEVDRRGWAREHVAMGTNTDPYQRAEGRYALMPTVIGALADSGTPFSILTKGTVLGRDLPLLAQAARSVPVGLGVSLALLDPELQAVLEPGAPSPQARLNLVRRITDAGLPCGVFIAPVLPYLTDSDEQIERLVAALADAGATGVSGIALHLRPGAREWFFGWLTANRPDLVPRYERLYAGGANLQRSLREQVTARVRDACRRVGLGSFGDSLRGVPGDRDSSFPHGSLPRVAAREPEPAPTLF